MTTAVETPHEGKAALIRFLMGAPALPDDVKETLTNLTTDEPSGVPVCVQASELIYARADELPVELIELGAQMAALCANYRLQGMADDNRGYAIAATLRKRPGVAPAPPAPSTLTPPEPVERYKNPKAVAAEVEAPKKGRA